MAQYQGRKAKLDHMKKKRADLGSDPRKPKLADADKEEARENVRVRGGGYKTVVNKVKFVNVSIPGGKTTKVAIKLVEDNPADKEFRRENILSLGGVLDTELGKVKITSRPSQDGVVNAVLLK
jgi:small subunit ribosomal protein S8e